MIVPCSLGLYFTGPALLSPVWVQGQPPEETQSLPHLSLPSKSVQRKRPCQRSLGLCRLHERPTPLPTILPLGRYGDTGIWQSVTSIFLTMLCNLVHLKSCL